MARRVSLLKTLRNKPSPSLVISGGHEFFPDAAPDMAVSPPPDFSPDTLRHVYDRTRTDVGYVGTATASFFSASLPQGFTAVAAAPVTRRLQAGTAQVAVILFPPTTDADLERLSLTLLDAARAASEADIVIGVSPWGFRLEGKSLARLAEGFDLLLGSGPGAPFPFEVPVYAPGIVWSRADRDARSITELSFFTLPGPRASRPRSWLAHIDVQAVEHPLGMNIIEDYEAGALPLHPGRGSAPAPRRGDDPPGPRIGGNIGPKE